MARISRDQSRREMRLLTFVTQSEYQEVQARYRASNAPSLREYQRNCLLGRSLRKSRGVEVGRTYAVLGEISLTLRLALKALEQLNEQVEFDSEDLEAVLTDLRLSLNPLRDEIDKICQQLIPPNS